MSDIEAQHIVEWLERHKNADHIVMRLNGKPYYAFYEAHTEMYKEFEPVHKADDLNETNNQADGSFGT